MILPSVARSIADGLKLDSFAGPLTTSFKRIGDLIVPSKRMAGGDPNFLKDLRPFDLKIDLRSAPVVLTLARYPDGDERIAAARIELAPGHPHQWREAGEFGVDSGVACFLDAAAATKLNRLSLSTLVRHQDALHRAMKKNYAETRSWGSIAIEPSSGANLVGFSSGFGDGGYGTYVGMDKAGKPLVLLTDFALLLTQDEVEGLDEEI
jgi:hypothetical protein